jgi:hypothetical protein
MSIATEIQRLQTAKVDIKTAIENKGVEVGNGTIDTYAEKIGEISVGGSLGLERYAKQILFASLNLFGKEEVTLNLDNATSLNGLFRSYVQEDDNTTVKHLTINCLQPLTNISQMISALDTDETLERITLNHNNIVATSVTYMFNRLKALKVIDGTPLDFSTMTSISTATFAGCSALEEIRFKPNSIFVNFAFSHPQNLSAESVQSVIDGLADLTGNTTQTLTLNKTVGAKLTDEQKAIITAKNWILAY